MSTLGGNLNKVLRCRSSCLTLYKFWPCYKQITFESPLRHFWSYPEETKSVFLDFSHHRFLHSCIMTFGNVVKASMAGCSSKKINSKTAASLFYGHVRVRGVRGHPLFRLLMILFLHKEPECTNEEGLEFSTTLLNERPFCWNLKLCFLSWS